MYNFHFTVKGDDALEQIFIIIVTKFLFSVIDRIFFFYIYKRCLNFINVLRKS